MSPAKRSPMSFSTIIVAVNAQLLRRVRLSPPLTPDTSTLTRSPELVA